MATFKAVRIDKAEKGTTAALAQFDDAELMDGDVTVAVEWSTVNYKDGLAITGKSPVVRRFPMIAGIVVMAVGDELQIAHPLGHATPQTVIALLGGPALFLAGHAVFKYCVFNTVSHPRLVAIVLLILVGIVGQAWSPLAIATAAMLILIGVSVADVRTAHYREQRALHNAG